MKLSTKGRYGLSAMIDLAVNSQDDVVSMQSIARRQQISEHYLEQLLSRLRKAALVTSARGAFGGYRLARPAEEISVGDVLRALEGNLDAVTCHGYDADGGCDDADFCVTKAVWKRINDGIAHAVDTMMLSELAEESRRLMESGQARNVTCAGNEK